MSLTIARTSGKLAFASATVKNFFLLRGLSASMAAPLRLGRGREFGLLCRRRIGRLGPDRLGLHFGCSNRHRIERRLAPRYLYRQLSIVHNAPVATEAALVVRRAHEDAVNGTGIDAQGTEHALGVVDLEPVDAEAFACSV